MIAQLACRLRFPAFAKHYSETVSRKKAPSRRINRIFSKSKDLDVVFGTEFQVADGQDGSRVDDTCNVPQNLSNTLGRQTISPGFACLSLVLDLSHSSRRLS